VFSTAILQLESFVSQFSNWKRLGREDLRPYSRFVDGWEIPGLCSDQSLRLRLLVDPDLPYSPPRLAVFPAPDVLNWPNLEPNGLLCIFPDGTMTSLFDLGSVALTLLEDGQRLVNESLQGIGKDRFEDEFDTYWGLWNRRTKNFVSLCRPGGNTRWIFSYSFSEFILVADSSDDIKSWGRNFSGKELKNKWIEEIPFIVLEKPWHPMEYPKFVRNLLVNIRDDNNANEIVQEYLLTITNNNRKKILVGFPGRNGFGFAGLVLPPIGDFLVEKRRPRTPIEKIGNGFRPGKLPGVVLLSRLCPVPLKSASVNRCDPSWVHGRDHNSQTELLKSKSVVFVGVGSLGSGVVELIAKVGVGKICLVDPDSIGPENASRHTLGVRPSSASKAEALGRELGRKFPHISFEVFPVAWRRVYERTPKVFHSADLIISTVGEMAAEGPLNELASKSKDFPPVIFGWLENNAAVGHVIGVNGTRGCLFCLMDELGQISMPVTRWKNITTYRVPMCGGVFQPYGAVELANVQAVLADYALDFLLSKIKKPFHKIWVGQKKLLGQENGDWNKEWEKKYGELNNGGRVLDIPLAINKDCSVCR